MSFDRAFSFWWERLGISLRRRGIPGTAARIFHYCTVYLSRGGWRERRFDALFGVDTSGRLGRYELGVKTLNLLHAVEYRPTPVREFVRIINDLRIDYKEWTFIDLGAGKGRAILLASHFPFRQVIGVEFAPELVRIAQCNIAAYKNPSRECQDLNVLLQDATEYCLPCEKCVIYLNNPFDGPVMARVIENIGASVEKFPRDLYVVYWNPFCSEFLDSAPFLAKIRRTTQYCIYGTRRDLTTKRSERDSESPSGVQGDEHHEYFSSEG